MPVAKSFAGTPNKGKPAAFGGTQNRFASPSAASSGSTSYDITHGTMGAAVSKKSFNKSKSATFTSQEGE